MSITRTTDEKCSLKYFCKTLQNTEQHSKMVTSPFHVFRSWEGHEISRSAWNEKRSVKWEGGVKREAEREMRSEAENEKGAWNEKGSVKWEAMREMRSGAWNEKGSVKWEAEHEMRSRAWNEKGSVKWEAQREVRQWAWDKKRSVKWKSNRGRRVFPAHFFS